MKLRYDWEPQTTFTKDDNLWEKRRKNGCPEFIDGLQIVIAR